jgi:hypothetical protein
MSEQAKVSSIFMLKQLRASLGTFAEIASVAIDEAGTDIQHTLRWLREDQYRHWEGQVRTRTEQFVQAKLALKRRQIFDRALSGTTSSCIDERKALKLAEARLQEAEHKFSRVKAWSQQIDKELSDYRGAVQKLVNAVEVEIPNARARLDKMIDSLEAYVALAPPEMPVSAEAKPEVIPVQPYEEQPEKDIQSTAEQDLQGQPDEKRP